jgi:hypothetical protein
VTISSDSQSWLRIGSGIGRRGGRGKTLGPDHARPARAATRAQSISTRGRSPLRRLASPPPTDECQADAGVGDGEDERSGERNAHECRQRARCEDGRPTGSRARASWPSCSDSSARWRSPAVAASSLASPGARARSSWAGSRISVGEARNSATSVTPCWTHFSPHESASLEVSHEPFEFVGRSNQDLSCLGVAVMPAEL